MTNQRKIQQFQADYERWKKSQGSGLTINKPRITDLPPELRSIAEGIVARIEKEKI